MDGIGIKVSLMARKWRLECLGTLGTMGGTAPLYLTLLQLSQLSSVIT